MKKTRMEKGITLVALIITIVVLLILAVVAINAITDTDLIEKTNTAATTYNNSVTNEEGILNGYVDKLNQALGQGATSWQQNGETITRKNSDGTTTTLTVGDSVLLGEEGIPYSANGNSNWEVLGVQNGSLLLVSAESIGEKTPECYYETDMSIIENELDAMCDDYLNTDYATEARSIRKEDVENNAGIAKISIGATYLLADVFMEDHNGDYWFYIYTVETSAIDEETGEDIGEGIGSLVLGNSNINSGNTDPYAVRAVVVLKPDLKVVKN